MSETPTYIQALVKSAYEDILKKKEGCSWDCTKWKCAIGVLLAMDGTVVIDGAVVPSATANNCITDEQVLMILGRLEKMISPCVPLSISGSFDFSFSFSFDIGG